MPRATKPKGLTPKQRPIVVEGWEAAVADPEWWRATLMARAADDTNRFGNADSVAAAWGLQPDGKTPLPQYAHLTPERINS